jgi:regulator of sirC expression with transglutaminase-like and TPR domain
MSHDEVNCEFGKLLAGNRDIDLVQFMLEIAADAYPHLDRVGCLVEIDHLGVACHDKIAGCHSEDVAARLAAVSRLLFEVEGFQGNREAYYEPQNSYLNQVLARRRGIPISLGILYMAVAARAGLKTFGVNTPGHFVVGCATAGEPLFVDPFNGGDVLDQPACRRRVEQMIGRRGVVTGEHFRPAASIEIAARVLHNLKAAHALENDWPQVLAVQRRLAALLPQCPHEKRDLGLVYLRLGQPNQALCVWQSYLKVCESGEADELAPSIKAARRMLVESN